MLHLDTHKTIKLLKEHGYTESQAEGMVNVIQEVTVSRVATREDVQEVRNEIQEVRNEVQELKIAMHSIKNEMLKFLIMQTIAITGVIVAMAQF